MTISNLKGTGSTPSFKGYDKYLDKNGNEVHKFYYPHSEDYKLQLERCYKDKITGELKPQPTLDIDDKSIDIKIPEKVGKHYDVFYRFKLTPNNSSKSVYAFDNGLIAKLGEVNGSSEPFNQIFTDRKIVSKPGRMQLQFPDIFYPGIEEKDGVLTPNEALRAKALSTVRTHVTKLGGTLNGMTYMLPQRAKEGYTRIVGNPFTKDEVSSHLYWTQNAYQMAEKLGTGKDLKRFQQELFKNGMNFIIDAALVNEGLQGIHISNLLKWGEKSPFFPWFKTFDLDSNLLSLGVIPKDTKHVRMRIINSPVDCKSNPVTNQTYDANRPTYVQLYDDRLASESQIKANKPFSSYEKNTENHYEITSYDDAIIPYYFEVNPKELADNIKKHGGKEEGAFSDIDKIMNILSFSKFKIGEREDGGIELWDGNVDIAKLNFSIGNYDVENLNKTGDIAVRNKVKEFKQGVREVQDYSVLSGKYWVKSAADTQLEFAANAFKNVETVEDAMKCRKNEMGKTLPNSVAKVTDKEIIANVLNGNYNLFKLHNISTYTEIDEENVKTEKTITSYKDSVVKSIMNLPMEVLETDNDTAAILSTGYLTKRAGTDEQIGLTRFDIYKSDYPNLPEKYADLYKKVDSLLSENAYDFIDNILTTYANMGDTPKIKTPAGDTTTFGKYVINAVVPELTKYALIKAMDKDADIRIAKDGSLDFDHIDKTRLSIKALDIQDISPEAEAKNLVNKIEEGLKELSNDQKSINELSTALSVRLKGLNENSFKLADMIIDRTESGMGLRVDATKDVAAFDSVRNTTDDIAKAWMTDVLGFWSKYVKEGVQKENPHAFSTAEVTDVGSFIKGNPIGALKSAAEAERILLKDGGVTSIANYSYFFSMPTEMYSASPENGELKGGVFAKPQNIKSKIDCLDNKNWTDGLIFEGMPDSSIHSYTFVGNHDKPRILHVMGLDMSLYKSDFCNEDHRKIAADVLMEDLKDIDFENISAESIEGRQIAAPAIAMGYRIKNVVKAMNEAAAKDENTTEAQKEQNEKDFEKISKAISRLARGVYKVDGEDKMLLFHPTSFGEKPFDVVIHDVIKTANLDMSEDKQKELENKIFEAMMKPAMKKVKSIYKMLTLLPGDPTDFAGDKEGLTGFESKCKNLTQQNRNAIRWEWLDENNSKYYKPFIKQFKEEMDTIMALRTKPELSALNNGHTVSLVNYNTVKEFAHPKSRKYAANFRYNAEGSQVITIFGQPDLANASPETEMGNKKVEIPYINLGKVLSREGLSAGLAKGTVFVNPDPNANIRTDKETGEAVIDETTGEPIRDNIEYKVEEIEIELPKEAPKDTDYTEFAYEDFKNKKGYITEKTKVYALRKYVNGKVEPITVGRDDDNALALYKKS